MINETPMSLSVEQLDVKMLQKILRMKMKLAAIRGDFCRGERERNIFLEDELIFLGCFS